MSNKKVALWRQRIRESNSKLDDNKKAGFLEHLSQTGEFAKAAAVAGVTGDCIRRAMNEDKEFGKAVDWAREQWADQVFIRAKQQSLEGIDEIVIGGRNRDTIIKDENGNPLVKKAFPNNPILQMEMKRTNPEYRDKHEIDLNVGGGVLIAPAEMAPSEWIQKHATVIEAPAEEKTE